MEIQFVDELEVGVDGNMRDQVLGRGTERDGWEAVYFRVR